MSCLNQNSQNLRIFKIMFELNSANSKIQKTAQPS